MATVWIESASAIAGLLQAMVPGEFIVCDIGVGASRSTGNSISPAPCADAMRKDQKNRSLAPTLKPPPRGWLARNILYAPSEKRMTATTTLMMLIGRRPSAKRRMMTALAIAAA